VPAVSCAQDLANLGGSTNLTYQHDTVKSTEVGGKFRLFDGQMQVNASAFHIDWQNVQFVVPFIFCSFSYVANAAAAVSNGAELQMSGRVAGFTLNGNVAYDDAHYTAAVLGPLPPAGSGKVQSVLANKGDNLGVPDWTANVGVQYDWHTFELPTYARMDYTYTGKYARGTSVGTTSYNPLTTPGTVNGDVTNQINARVGVYYKDLEIAGYVKNLADERAIINKTVTSATYWYNETLENPRVIGMQMNYRF